MGRTKKLTMEQCIEIRTRREAGETYAALVFAYGVAEGTIRRAVAVAGGDAGTRTSAMLVAKAANKDGPRRRVDAYVNSDGYRRVVIDRGDPMFEMGSTHGKSYYSTRTVLEHRLVLARKLGRALFAHETVHHKDGDRQNNHPDNLELRVGRHGKGATEAHCATCRCFEGTAN